MPSLRGRFVRFTLRDVKNMDIWGPTIQEARTRIERQARIGIHPPRGVAIRSTTAHTVPGEWVEPKNADPRRVILYLHGGGYVLCSPATHRGLVGRIALSARARALLIDYRLAPENSFPAALEDALSAYRWLLDQNIPANQIAIGGDSAGGGLAIATALSLRDSGDPLPAALCLLSPWTDLTFSGETSRTREKADPILRPGHDGTFARLYAGNRDLTDPLLSPLFGDMHGLSPTLVHVGEDEILLSDSTRLVEKMKAAGVEAWLEVWDGMWHVFQVYAPWVPEAQKSIETMGKFIRQHIP